DELKYHISKPAMEGLGAARDKGVHMFLAHQSIADLKDCPADLNGDAVVGAVVENTKFKLVYRLQDPDTAKWVSEMSGTILVDDETRYVEANKSLSEVVEDKRNIRMAERQYVDTNMLLNLPAFVSYIFTTNDVPKPSLIAPIKVQKQQLVTFDETQQAIPDEPEELTQESEEPVDEPLVHEDEHNEPDESPTPQESVADDVPNELDLNTVKLATNNVKSSHVSPEEETTVEALANKIDGLNE
ncbi:TraM recognition domain-containing protein, partial [Vibrio parahaemolyticus]